MCSKPESCDSSSHVHHHRKGAGHEELVDQVVRAGGSLRAADGVTCVRMGSAERLLLSSQLGSDNGRSEHILRHPLFDLSRWHVQYTKTEQYPERDRGHQVSEAKQE